MKRKLIFFYFVSLIAAASANSQIFSPGDSTTVLKDLEGKILAKQEVQELIKSTFSMRRKNENGKEVITIIPSPDSTIAERSKVLEALKKKLMNKPLPQFRIPGFYYQVWDSKQLKGRVLVINFWFTACGPCIKEMPLLNELAASYNVKNVIFLAPAPEKPAKIKRFLKKNTFKYNIIPASKQYIKAMGIENFPTHLVIDKNGIIRQVFIGYDEEIKEKLEGEIDKLIKERW
jgi:thiol-disulfide isomerase/thioredoxin